MRVYYNLKDEELQIILKIYPANSEEYKKAKQELKQRCLL
jgi:hypothetical protein